jgi:hypothetical protein
MNGSDSLHNNPVDGEKERERVFETLDPKSTFSWLISRKDLLAEDEIFHIKHLVKLCR